MSLGLKAFVPIFGDFELTFAGFRVVSAHFLDTFCANLAVFNLKFFKAFAISIQKLILYRNFAKVLYSINLSIPPNPS